MHLDETKIMNFTINCVGNQTIFRSENILPLSITFCEKPELFFSMFVFLVSSIYDFIYGTLYDHHHNMLLVLYYNI